MNGGFGWLHFCCHFILLNIKIKMKKLKMPFDLQITRKHVCWFSVHKHTHSLTHTGLGLSVTSVWTWFTGDIPVFTLKDSKKKNKLESVCVLFVWTWM